MNIFSKVLLAATLTTVASSCNSFLDVNTNPNSATSVTPDQLLANALVSTGANYTNFNSYTSFTAGFWGKANGVSGYNVERAYNYTSTYQQGLWTGIYDNLQDYQLIRTSAMVASYPNHAAIARIMQAYDFLLLVDQYGDIPYTNALQGATNTTPAFDKAEVVYKDLIVQLKGAIADINAATAAAKPGTEDVVFGGGTAGMTKWKQFANSLRLRILLRQSSTSDGTRNAYVATEMAALQASTDGYITTDVVVQPGYAASSGQQNPFYNTYGFAVGSSATVSTYRFILPTNYLVNLFRNNSDTRLVQEFRPISGTTTTYLGTNLGEPLPPDYLQGSTFQAALAGNPAGTFAGTFLRSPSQPTVLMLLAEHLFSKSEAETRSLLTNGDAKTDYLNGIRASYQTTYRSGTAPAAVAATAESEAYLAANVGNGLVDWDATTTRQTNTYGTITTGTRTVSRTEKILTQKWLAENTFASTEAYDDYRRTSLPNIPISLEASQPALGIPTRLLYPQVEINTNGANVTAAATGVTQYTHLFWDPI
ncbi:MAG: SusD/RagB family nutrient-binding outer membrane lipoprotein [Hymenobacter sp.]|nr:MAG: SusD/RagB family nutrient-binding outer membrane lipoprotein [Hymenobacter sp.]